MDRRLAWLIVPVLAVVVWLVVRHRDEAAPAPSKPVAPLATERVVPAGSPGTPQAEPARPEVGAPPSSPPAAVTGSPATAGVASAGSAGRPPAAQPGVPSAAGAPPAAGALPSTGSAAPTDPDAPAGKFTDKTGWGDASIGKQLNKEFMPLASECIEQAKARKPKLTGLLAFTMVLAPTETGKAIVSSIKPRPDNQIDEPELFECIRESSFSMEGLKAPHDFDITMPIKDG